MQKCDKCGKPSEIDWIDLGNDEESHLCLECNNKIQSDNLGIELPEIARHSFILTDCDQELHLFDSEYIITPMFKLLRCFERGPARYKCEVQDSLDADYKNMFAEMIRRLNKMLSTKYMEFGTWIDYNIYGHISVSQEKEQFEIIVDGKPYTWEEIGKSLRDLDGFQIKIDTANPTVDFEPDKDNE